MNVVIYARYSSHSQTEQSIEGQLKECYEFARKNDYIVIGEYIDRAITGTSDNRPEFKKMIDDSSKKQFSGVIVYQFDRFARNRYDSATYKNKLKKNGVRVFSARENISEDASGILVEGLLESMAEYYSAELSQKITRGMEINASKFLHTGGNNLSLGFKIDEEKKYQIDEETAPIVKKIFEMYIDGTTMAEIIRYLNIHNYKTSRNKEFNKNSIRKILLNKRYIGTYIYKDKEAPNAIPRIINDEVFNKAQEIMFKNKKAPARARAKAEYLLTTKLFCGHCKEMMTGISSTSHTGRKYNYYSCKNAIKKVCNKKKIGKDQIENLIVLKAREFLTKENISIIAKQVFNYCEKEKDNSILKQLNKALKDNQKKYDNLIKAVSECDIEGVRKSLYLEVQKIEQLNKEINKEILKEEGTFNSITEKQIQFFLMQIQKGNIEDIRYKKMLINILVNKIYLYDDNAIIIFNTQNQQLEIKLDLLENIEKVLLKGDELHHICFR
ncbi:MAG: recombinase family protein [Bacilli bacterium]|nr:recombinase family protein [Bacilli bacterium]